MNRKEQIRNASKECMVKSYASKFENYIKQSAFISGAKWADKHPVSPWIPLDGKHKEPPYKRTIAVYYPLGGGRVELVERSEKTGTPSVNGSYQDQIDEYGLPVISTSHRAAMICNYYSVRATMYMDIADPTEEEIEYTNSTHK